MSISEFLYRNKEAALAAIATLMLGAIGGGAATGFYLKPSELIKNMAACHKLEGTWRLGGGKSQYRIYGEKIKDYEIVATDSVWDAKCSIQNDEVILGGEDRSTHEIRVLKNGVRRDAQNSALIEVNFKGGYPHIRSVHPSNNTMGSLKYTDSKGDVGQNPDMKGYEDYVMGAMHNENRCAVLANDEMQEITFYCELPDNKEYNDAFIKRLRKS